MRRLPYLVTVMVPLQSVLAALGLRYVLYALLALGTAAFLWRAAVHGRGVAGFGSVWFWFAYVAVLSMAQAGLVSLYGLLSYAQFALFWLSYAYAYGPIDVAGLARVNLMVAAVVACVGLIQFLVSPTLWGFSTYAGAEVFVHQGGALRINSVLPSAMTLGAYLVISALLGLAVLPQRRGTVVAEILCVGGAFLTGNKSTLFCLGVALLYGLVERGVRRHGMLGPLLGLGAGGAVYLALVVTARNWGPWLEDLSATLYRAVAPFFFAGDTSQFATLLVYWRLLFLFYGGVGPGTLAFGHGVGLTRQSTTFFGGRELGDVLPAESFLIQVLFELGVVGLVLLHVVLWKLFRSARTRRVPGRIGLDHVLVAMYANMIIVHVFSGIYLGFMWGVFGALLGLARQKAVAGAPILKPASSGGASAS